jgi:opacity protein-like surface antigen
MNQSYLYAFFLFLFSLSIHAGTVGSLETTKAFRPLISLQGGYACIEASKNTQQFDGSDSNLFIYEPSGKSCDAGFYGVFLGGEQFVRNVSEYPVFLQLGLEYNYFSNIKNNGVHWVGVDAASFTQYDYQFNLKTQQVLADIKLFIAKNAYFHPYGEAGLGIAFNRAGRYSTSTAETGALNFTPTFVGGNSMKLSYMLGLGIDGDVCQHVRVGLGYRLSYFNTASLGNGSVDLGSSATSSTQAPVSFKLVAAHLYANQFIGHITYIF